MLLSGEAGIGKSRLTAALLERLATEPHTRLRYFCSPQHTDSALYPIISHMERAAGLMHDDIPRAKLDKLDALLAQSFTPPHDAALFAEMLSLPNDGRYQILELAPQQRRQKTLKGLTAQLEGLSQSRPVLMIFEDAHWADPTSLEAFGRAVDRIKALPVLLLVTYRPEFEPPWIGEAHVTALTVNRLTRREVDALIESVVRNKALPESIRHDIIERTDGIPLFVEEMTKAVLEAGGQRAAERTVAALPASASAVPATLHASLMARLDRLGGPAKEVVQIGAAIGREFSYALLAAVLRKPEVELQLALDRIVAAGLLFRQGVPPHAAYLFKHALLQDAAYGTLLREPRKALHARISETLESQFTEIAENQPELLARHCTEAGLIEKAARLWGKAGQRSLERSALLEAAEQLTRAIDQIAGLPSTPALRREQIKLQVGLVHTLMNTKGHATDETKEALGRARSLIEQAEALGEPVEDPLLLFIILYGFWVSNFGAFNGDVLRDLSAQFLTLAETQSANAPLMIGHRLRAQSLLLTGDIPEGRAHYDQALALYDPVMHRPLAMRFGQDVRVAILVYRSQALWLLGYPEAALADAEQALSSARAIDHATTLMHALSQVSYTYSFCGKYAAANMVADELVASANAKGAQFWKAGGMAIQASVFALAGKAFDASALTAYRSTGATTVLPLLLSCLARGYAELGEYDDASRCIGEAISIVETTGERWHEAEVNRVAGEIALKWRDGDVVKAEAYFDRALRVARTQQARSLELRAAMSLARLWRDQGKASEARELLVPVYGWFTEGHNTRDLKEAKALLEELAS